MKENFKQAEETFKKNADTSAKWFQETTAVMTDAYNKQFTLGFDIYKKWFDAAFNVDYSPLSFFEKSVELYKKNVDTLSGLSKETLRTTLDFFNNQTGGKQFESATVLSEEIADAINEAFNKQTKLTVEFNEKYFDTVREQFKDAEISFDDFSEKLQEVLINTIEVSDDSIKTILDGYRGQADYSLETNEKLLGELNKLIDFATKSTLAFWEDLLNTISGSATKQAKPSNLAKGEVTPQRKSANKSFAKKQTVN